MRIDPEETTGTWEQQVHTIDLSSESTDKEIEKLQTQPGTDLAQIQAHVYAGTVPEEYELEQGSWKFKSLATLIPKMHLHNSIQKVRKMRHKHREW